MSKKTVTAKTTRANAAPTRRRTKADGAAAAVRATPAAGPPAARGKRRAAQVGIVMGSRSDWSIMQHAAEMLAELGIPFEARIVSAHRTPDELYAYAEQAAARGLRLIIAGAGGSAHLPGMLAAKTVLPVLGVPVPTRRLQGLDSLLSIVQMPKGVPVATFAIGEAGAANAALFAAALLAHDAPAVAAAVARFRQRQTAQVRAMKLPRVS